MPTLRSLVERLETGDWLLWIGEKSMSNAGERAYPNKITQIKRDEEVIRVKGKGTNGGEYYFELYQDGGSKAFYANPSKAEPDDKGSVAVALLTDSDDPVYVRREYADLRD